MKKLLALISAVVLTASAFAQTVTASGAATTVRFSNDFVGAARALNLHVSALQDSSIFGWRGRFFANFPITDGELDLQTARGEISHKGGLQIATGQTEVKLRSFVIDTTGDAPVLTGLVVVNDSLVDRVPLFDIALPSGFSVPIRPQRGTIFIRDAKLTLTDDAAGALNSIFGVTAFAEGLNIGDANVLVVGH